MGLSGRAVGLSGRARCVLSVVIAAGLVAAVAALADDAAALAAALALRSGRLLGVTQASWFKFLVFDLVCGMEVRVALLVGPILCLPI